MGAIHEISESVLIRLNQAVITIPARTVIDECIMRAPVTTIVGAELKIGFTAPRVGAYWEGEGGLNAGVMLDDDGKRQYHLIVPPRSAGDHPRLNFDKANRHAAGIRYDGHADFSLMTPREGRLALVNVRDQFYLDEWYWLAKQHESVPASAWAQLFLHGHQDLWRKYDEFRVLPVRRVFIP